MTATRRPCRVLVCTNHRFGPSAESCGRRGADRVLAALRDAAATGLLPEDTSVEAGPCLGHCTKGPNVRVAGGALLHDVTTNGDGEGDGLARVVAAVVETRTDKKTHPAG